MVRSGDIVVADEDGVVVVPCERIDQVIAGLATVRTKEQRVVTELAAGRTVPAWVDDYANLAGRERVE
jgi:regulator of RNase E activity RraA